MNIRVSFLILVLAAQAGTDASPTPPDSGLVPCVVTRIKDADTIDCDGLGAVRLIGIDAPDRYNRLLAYAWLGNTLLNWSLVRQGWAVAYPYKPNLKYASQFEQAEFAAKGESRGLWQINGFACRPVERRRKAC